MAALHHKGAAAVHQAVLVPTDVDGDHMLQTEVEHNVGLDQGRNQACKGNRAVSGTPRRRRSSEAADTSSLAPETCKAMCAYSTKAGSMGHFGAVTHCLNWQCGRGQRF
jgi:hypothetical protein